MKLIMGDNSLNGADTGDAGRALGAALAANTVLKELDLSSPKGYWCDAEFIQTFSIGLGANGALTSLNLSNNSIGEMVKGPLPEGWKSKDDDDVAPWLRIADGHEQDEHPGEETFPGVIAISNAIPTMGALTSLNLASNALGPKGAKRIAKAIKGHVSALRFDWHHFELDLTSGSTAVVYGYSYYNTTKGALASLDLSQSDIPAEEMGPIERLCESKRIALRK